MNLVPQQHNTANRYYKNLITKRFNSSQIFYPELLAFNYWNISVLKKQVKYVTD